MAEWYLATYQNGVFLFTDWCSSEIFSLKITPKGNEFFVYEDVQILNYESNAINPNLLKTIGEKTFLLTVNGEVFEFVDLCQPSHLLKLVRM